MKRLTRKGGEAIAPSTHPLQLPPGPRPEYSDYQTEFGGDALGDSLREPESYMIETLRHWTMAQADPIRRRRLEAWHGMAYYVNGYIDGEHGDEEAVTAYCDEEDTEKQKRIREAVRTIAQLLPLFDLHNEEAA